MQRQQANAFDQKDEFDANRKVRNAFSKTSSQEAMSLFENKTDEVPHGNHKQGKAQDLLFYFQFWPFREVCCEVNDQ